MNHFQIDHIYYGNHRIYIKGWAVPDNLGTASVRLIGANNESISAVISYDLREDVAVNLALPEGEHRFGFTLFARVDTEKDYSLVVTDDQKKVLQKVNVRKAYEKRFSKKQEKATLLFHDFALEKRGIYEKIETEDEVYNEWFENRRATKLSLETEKNASFKYSISFGIFLRVDAQDDSLVEEVFQSLRSQSYPHFHVYVEAKSASSKECAKSLFLEDSRFSAFAAFSEMTEDFVIMLDTSGILMPNALYEFALKYQEDPETKVMYSDTDVLLDRNAYHYRHFMKPDYSYAYLRGMNYIGQGYAFQTSLLQEAAFADVQPETLTDYDFLLRVMDAAENRKIVHIAKVLYAEYERYGESELEKQEKEKKEQEEGVPAIQASYERASLKAKVTSIPETLAFHTTPILEEEPLVSILIPNKDHKEDLEKCLKSLWNISTYNHFEVIIIENNSTTPEIFAYYEKIKALYGVQVVTFEGTFNYSKINNFGARYAHGDYLLLLNNDTQVITPDFLQSMVFYAMCPNTGIVGAKLLYEDETIQHAGVLVGVDGKEINHIYAFTKDKEVGYGNRLLVPNNYSAVTAACLLVAKADYVELAGLNEDLAVAYNDIEFCLRMEEKGKGMVYDAFAKLFHYESKSRGYEVSSEDQARREREKEKLANRFPNRMKFDPYYNENLSIEQGTYLLPVPKKEADQKDRDRLFFFVDYQIKSDKGLTICGWSISTKHSVSVSVKDAFNRPVPYTIEPMKRTDASFAIMHDYTKQDCGFKLHFDNQKGAFFFLVVEDGKLQKRKLITKSGLKQWPYQIMATIKAYIKNFSEVKETLREEGFAEFMKQTFGDMKKSGFRYANWFKKHAPGEKELAAQRKEQFSYQPKISLIVPAYRTPEKFLREMVDSVKAQTYTNWELCVADGSYPDDGVSRVLTELEKEDTRIVHQVLTENYGISGNTNEALKLATGDWIALMDHDDILVPDTLYEMVKVMNEVPETDVIYTDEDKINVDLSFVFEPAFKPDYDESLFTSGNYICHFFAAKKEVIKKVGPFDPLCDGAQDFDFILRAIYEGKKVSHIGKVLYHWRSHPNSTAGDSTSKMYCYEAGVRSVNKHFERKHIPAKAYMSPCFGHYHTFYENGLKEEPLISVIVVGNQESSFEKTKASVLHASDYQNYEFILADSIAEGVKKAGGEYLYLIGAGSVLVPFQIETPWGDRLSEELIHRHGFPYNFLGELQFEGASIVGGKVTDSEKKVFFGGSRIHPKHGVDELFKGEEQDSFGYMFRLMDRRHMNFLSFQNAMMKRSTYFELGGISSSFQSLFGEVDFCFKAREAQMELIFDPIVLVQTDFKQSMKPFYLQFEKESRLVAKLHKDFLSGKDIYETDNMTDHMKQYVLKEK